MSHGFSWNGEEMVNYGDIGGAAIACSSKEEFEKFMNCYRAVSDHADGNVRYMVGYYADVDCDRIRKWLYKETT